MLSPPLFNIFFAAGWTLYSRTAYAAGGVEAPLERVRRAVRGLLYADNAGITSRSPAGLARMMTAIVEVFEDFG